eukprot:scaffold20523_cov73-Skeletonema_marinoi.AAC.1
MVSLHRYTVVYVPTPIWSRYTVVYVPTPIWSRYTVVYVPPHWPRYTVCTCRLRYGLATLW